VIILVKAGAPVDSTITELMKYMEPNDIIIDGGNEWCVRQRRCCRLYCPALTS
jgi:6-phosphogluconate dehydrogenase